MGKRHLKRRESKGSDFKSSRILYVVLFTIAVQFFYPISVDVNGTPVEWRQFLYQLFYMSFFVAGIFLARANRLATGILIVTAGLWVALSVGLLVFPPDSTIYRVLFLVGYPLVLSFQLTLSWILWGFIFKAKRVGSDVLLAAVALYLLLGGIFVPIFGFVETWEWMFNGRHAFVDGLRDIPPDEIFPWQTISYYSYATLTTLGYGDVLPATTTARSIASFEAVVGVLGWWGCMRRMRLLGRSRKRGAGSREHEVGG